MTGPLRFDDLWAAPPGSRFDDLWGSTPAQASTARAMFADPFQVDPASLANVQQTAAEGVSEGPLSRGLHQVGRVGKQLVGNLGDQAAMIAGGAIGGGELLAGVPAEIAKLHRDEVADPIFAATTAAVGEPHGMLEKGARLVGPLPFIGGAKALASGLERKAVKVAAEGVEAAAPSFDAAWDAVSRGTRLAPEAGAVNFGRGPLRDAALRDPQNPQRIFTGSTHGEAYNKGMAAGIPEDQLGGFEYGFTAKDGEFLTREQATARVGMNPANGLLDASYFDRSGNPSEFGGAQFRTLAGVAGAGGGGYAGSKLDEEHPFRGAIVGALAGGALGAGAASMLERPGPVAKRLANRRGAVALPPEKVGDEAITQAINDARAPTPKLGEVNPDEFVNVSKFALDETGEQRLRTEVTRVVQKFGIAPKAKVTHEETRALAAQMGLGDLPAEELNTRLNGPQMLAIRNLVSSNVEALEGLYGKVKAGGLTPQDLATTDRSIGYLERENDALLSRFTRARTQTGRDLNNLKILANRVMDPFTWLTKAENLMQAQGKTLLPAQRQRITELVTSGDKAGLVEYVAGLRESKLSEQALTLWKTGLLTNPKTTLANMLGNVGMGGLETAKDFPAAIVDRVLSLGTGVHAKSFSVVGLAKASAKGAKEGAQEAWAIAKNGVPADLTRWDLPKEVTFKNSILRAYTQIVRRSLAAPDAFFKKVALHRALAEAQRLQPGPITEEMALQAAADAEYAVFQNNSRLAQAGSGFRRGLGTVGHVIAPFTQTPGNVVSATLDYSPFGAIRTTRDLYRLVKATKAGASPTELRALQKATSESAGRVATGVAPFLAGYILARKGLMTGTRPERKEERDQWDLEGKQENALHLGGKYYSLNRMAPMGNIMALGANYYELSQQPETTPLTAGAAALGSVGTTATEQSFLSGVQDLTEAIKNPRQAAGRYATNLAGSVVPAAVGAAARAKDRTVRDIQGPLDAIKARLPGVSQQLPAKVNAFGKPKQRHGPPAGEFLDPTTAKTEQRGDPVIRELSDLGISLGELGQGRPNAATAEKWRGVLPVARGKIARAYVERQVAKATQGEDRPNYLSRATTEGQALHRVLAGLIGDPGYRALGENERRDLLERAIDTIRRAQAQARGAGR